MRKSTDSLPSCNSSQYFKHVHGDTSLHVSAILESGKSINRLNISLLRRPSDFFFSLLNILSVASNFIVENDNQYKKSRKTSMKKILLSILEYLDDKKYNNFFSFFNNLIDKFFNSEFSIIMLW